MLLAARIKKAKNPPIQTSMIIDLGFFHIIGSMAKDNPTRKDTKKTAATSGGECLMKVEIFSSITYSLPTILNDGSLTGTSISFEFLAVIRI